ncbi:MAG: AMP-binding protein [Aromatoleum sp.]|nr:AMP-binding protein [Aromatoleum sp.]
MTPDRYAEIRAAHRWDVPRDFNIARACCGRWAGDRARFALYWKDESGAAAKYTFWDLQREANRLSNALAACGVGRGDMVASTRHDQPADWTWIGGLMDALLPTLYFGQPTIGYRGRFDPERAFALIEKYGIRNAFLFPTALKLTMKAFPCPRDRFDLHLPSIMSAVEAAGTTAFDWTRDALGATINEMFGQTEMNCSVGNSHTLWSAKPGSAGLPYPGHRIALIDDEGHEISGDEIGEVVVHRIAPDGTPDPVFFIGYFGNPEGTTNKFRGDWCRTVDLARCDAEGYLWYQGRADDMFKAAEYRIGPSAIENCLVRHAAVATAAVVASPDELRGNIVKAFIALTAVHEPSPALEDDIQQHVRRFLAPYAFPREIEFIDALPMTTTGKVQRRVLRERERKAAPGSRR